MSFPLGPRGLPGVGSLLSFLRAMPDFILAAARDYGDMAGFQLGPRATVLVNRPEWIQAVLVTDTACFRKSRGLQRAKVVLGEGLLTSEGAVHLRQRRLAQQAFHKARINSYAACMVEKSLALRESWRPGLEFDLGRAMMGLTLEIVCQTLFSAPVGGRTDDVNRAFTSVNQYFPFLILPFSELLDNSPFPFARRVREARALLDESIYAIIAEFHRTGEDKGDLLSMLMLARDTEGDGSGMSDQQLRDEVMTLFLAGHETTANALTWTFYLLGRHPEVEARFHQELDEVLEGRSPTLEDVDRLAYTRMVLAESMRLYPPAWIMGRQCLEDYSLGGYDFKAGTAFFMSPLATGRDGRFYPSPEVFDPLRFTPENSEGRHKFAYFPFGGGPRLCIGERFAWMEGILLLAVLGQRYRLRLVREEPAKWQGGITLRPRGGVPVRLEAR